MKSYANGLCFAVAPLYGVSNLPFRILSRLISRNALLYTEMNVASRIIREKQRIWCSDLMYHSIEHPIAAQIAGKDVSELCEAAEICEELGFDEVNINMGCPSPAVQSGKFGACLMLDKEFSHVVKRVRESVSIPVSIKCRIGVDQHDSYEFFSQFVGDMAAIAGIQKFIVHARKVHLKGLSTKDNRNVPSLNYDRVYQLKKDFPNLHIMLNGGIQSAEEAKRHVEIGGVDSVMIGRAFQRNIWLLKNFEGDLLSCDPKSIVSLSDRLRIAEEYVDYMDLIYRTGICSGFTSILKPIQHLFRDTCIARQWRLRLASLSAISKGKPRDIKSVLHPFIDEGYEFLSNLNPPERIGTRIFTPNVYSQVSNASY